MISVKEIKKGDEVNVSYGMDLNAYNFVKYYGFYDDGYDLEINVKFRLNEDHPYNALKAKMLENQAFFEQKFFLTDESIFKYLIPWQRFLLYNNDLIHLQDAKAETVGKSRPFTGMNLYVTSLNQELKVLQTLKQFFIQKLQKYNKVAISILENPQI